MQDALKCSSCLNTGLTRQVSTTFIGVLILAAPCAAAAEEVALPPQSRQDAPSLQLPSASESAAFQRSEPATAQGAGTEVESKLPTVHATGAAAQVMARDQKKYADFDTRREPMLTTQFPGIADTLLGDAGGVRSWLAQRDIGIEVQSATGIQFPMSDTGMPNNPQVYNGQKFTLRNNALNATVTIGLGHDGEDETRLIIGGGYSVTSFDPNGRDSATIKSFAIYRSFAGRKIEVKAGFLQNYLEYAGLLAGGNPVLTTGLNSLLPVQAGLSAEPTTAPGINVQVNGKHGFYVKAGVQRSMNPLGIAEDVRTNGFGFDFTQHDAKALYIGEIGINRKASPEERRLWLRAGYLYNTSNYTKYLGGQGDNYSFYALADYQFTRPDPVLFFRGLYAGIAFSTARKDVSAFSEAAELHFNYIGLLASRPTDALNVSFSYNRFSNDLAKSYKLAGIDIGQDQIGVSTSYALHVAPGTRLSPSLTYLVNPTFLPGYKDVLQGGMSLYIAF